MRVTSAELRAVDLPFRVKFKHAAAERTRSESLFLELRCEEGFSGWGESLPRAYVTGESRDDAFELLRERVLDRLVGLELEDFAASERFLTECDGKAPASWVLPDVPQSAAWACVDLALLDLSGRRFGHHLVPSCPPTWRHSGVLSTGHGWGALKSAFKQRLFGLRQLKVKVDTTTTPKELARLRAVIGRGADLRADANMAWEPDDAIAAMKWMSAFGLRSFEQPLAAQDIDGLARLVKETGLDVMADESFSDRSSLATLVQNRAVTAVSVRLSKCGGLVASRRRAFEATDAGLWFQVGCQVGESSLLSAAQMALLFDCPPARYVEGAFGTHLLERDPGVPRLEFSWGGKPPKAPTGTGFGIDLDRAVLDSATTQKARAGS